MCSRRSARSRSHQLDQEAPARQEKKNKKKQKNILFFLIFPSKLSKVFPTEQNRKFCVLSSGQILHRGRAHRKNGRAFAIQLPPCATPYGHASRHAGIFTCARVRLAVCAAHRQQSSMALCHAPSFGSWRKRASAPYTPFHSLSDAAFDMELDDVEGDECVLHSAWTETEVMEEKESAVISCNASPNAFSASPLLPGQCRFKSIACQGRDHRHH